MNTEQHVVGMMTRTYVRTMDSDYIANELVSYLRRGYFKSLNDFLLALRDAAKNEELEVIDALFRHGIHLVDGPVAGAVTQYLLELESPKTVRS